jgi:RimJ/RimL family protein N-acetyltransferase
MYAELLEPYRGQGWGGKLLHEVLRAMFQEDTTISRVELDVFASNEAAIKLYEKNGFVIEGRQRRGWILDGIQDDRLLMGLLREDWTFDVE